MSEEYSSYDDWYDHGPGSESFKREIQQSNLECIRHQKFPFAIKNKKIKTKKNGKNVIELLDSLESHLDADHKLSPIAHIPKGLLKGIVREGRRLYRYVEELESD